MLAGNASIVRVSADDTYTKPNESPILTAPRRSKVLGTDLRLLSCYRRFRLSLQRHQPFQGLIQFRRYFSICSFGMKEFAIPPTVIRCRAGSPKWNGQSHRFPGTNSSPAGAKVANSSKRRFGIFPSRIWRNRFLGVTILTKLCFAESWNTRFTIPGKSRWY